MADWAHEWTDEQIDALKEKFRVTYERAADEMRKKFETFLLDYGKQNKEWKSAVAAGTAKKQDYDAWLKAQSVRYEYLTTMVDTLSYDAMLTNQMAMAAINDAIPTVYAENANFAAYGLESMLGKTSNAFALVDQSTIRHIMMMSEHDQLIHEVIPIGPPKPDVQSLRVDLDAAKDVRWNRQKFTSCVTQSILQGESVPDAANRLKTVLNMNNTMAVRAARTAMTSAENMGRLDSYMRAKALGIDLEQQWLATLDTRTRPSHRELDGQHVPVGKYFVAKSTTGNRIRFPGDPAAAQEETWNCFVGDTRVATDSRVERSYKHEYSGELVTVKTATGTEFTCTPNHPILTPSGWVAAKLLDSGNDILITRRTNTIDFRRNPDIHHAFPSMKTLHELFAVIGGQRACGMTVNFHGDVATSNVEIVSQKRFLPVNLKSGRLKRLGKLLLEFSDSLCPRECPTMKGLLGVFSTASGIIRSTRVFRSFVRGHGSHANVHGLRATANLDTGVTEYPIDNIPAETVIRRELLCGLPGQVFVDKILSVKASSTRGTQVYNLQTENGYYFVGSKSNDNMIIAKNCRCTLIAWLPDDDTSIEDERWSNLPKGMTYDDWKQFKDDQFKKEE